MTSFDVRVFAIRRRPGRRAFEVRWRVAVHDRSRSFMTRALAACPRTGTAWTSTGTSFEPRSLKYRPRRHHPDRPRPSWSACSASTCTRSAPRRTSGCSGQPRRHAQRIGLRPRLAHRPPGRARPAAGRHCDRPPPLRPAHAALSLWLNASGEPAEAAARAGTSGRVLYEVYLHCIESHEDTVSQPIVDALDAHPSSYGHHDA